MLADGSDISAIERAMTESLMRGLVASRKIGVEWLEQQSREWAISCLSDTVASVAYAISRAAGGDGASGRIGVDRSSLAVSIEREKGGGFFLLRFSARLAYDRSGGEPMVVDTTVPEIDVGFAEVGELPDEVTSATKAAMVAIDLSASDSDLEEMLDALATDDPDEFLS